MTAAALAQDGATVRGTVRDSAGSGQVGTLVELLGPAHNVLASAFTDNSGRFVLSAPASGTFDLRASAAMFLPAVASSLSVKSGTTSVVNLTLLTLEDALQWLPAQRRAPGEPADEWKWTLRSPADRPLLRDFDPGPVITAGNGKSLERDTHARTALLSQSSFADAGLHQVITVDHAGPQETDYLFRADVAPSNSQSASATGSMSRNVAPGETFRTAANYQWHGDTSGEVANTLASATVRMSQTAVLPDGLTVEAGNELQAVSWGEHLLVAHPFANLTIASADGVAVTYSVSTSPGFASGEDVDSTIERPVLASPGTHGLTIEHGLHQQLTWQRQGPTGTISAAFFHDDVRDPVLQGAGSYDALLSSGLIAAYDPASNLFRETGPGYNSQGVALRAAHTIGPLDASITFVDANTLLVNEMAKGATTFDTRHGNAQMTTVALRGVLPASRTRLSASYGEETAGVVHSVMPFDLNAPSPYLNVMVRQPLHGRPGAPGSLEALIDVRNLLEQGYHPFVSADGETLYLVQVPRTIQGGLAFNF